jgi:SAM-dependent methyltransferase
MNVIRLGRVYLELCRDRRARTDPDHFVDLAFRKVLGRPAGEDGGGGFVARLRRGEVSRLGLLARLFLSHEYKAPAFMSTLHQLRCRLVQGYLPAADVIVDLGGACTASLEGALLWMGYPHRPRELTIVDLPPDERLYAGQFRHLHDEGGDWLVKGTTRIRYLHSSMTDLGPVADGSVDLVWSGESIEHITPVEGARVCREAMRVLRPGGAFCLDTPNAALTRIHCPRQFIHPEHKVEYRVHELIELLVGHGFDVRAVKGIGAMPRTARSGRFDPRELVRAPRLSDEAEISYLFYVHAVKPARAA